MKLYELIKVSYNKNFDTVFCVTYNGLHYEFKAKEFETFAGYELLKDTEVVLVRGWAEDELVVYVK